MTLVSSHINMLLLKLHLCFDNRCVHARSLKSFHCLIKFSWCFAFVLFRCVRLKYSTEEKMILLSWREEAEEEEPADEPPASSLWEDRTGQQLCLLQVEIDHSDLVSRLSLHCSFVLTGCRYSRWCISRNSNFNDRMETLGANNAILYNVEGP